MIIKSPVGLPGRAIRNKFLIDVHSGVKKKFKCPWKCLESCGADKANYCISIALNNARKGKMKHGYAFAGSNAYRVDSIYSVKDLIGELKAEYNSIADISFEKIRHEFDQIKEKLVKIKNEYEKIIEEFLSQLKDDYSKALQKKSESVNVELRKQKAKLMELKNEFKKGISDLSLLYKEFMAVTT